MLDRLERLIRGDALVRIVARRRVHVPRVRPLRRERHHRAVVRCEVDDFLTVRVADRSLTFRTPADKPEAGLRERVRRQLGRRVVGEFLVRHRPRRAIRQEADRAGVRTPHGVELQRTARREIRDGGAIRICRGRRLRIRRPAEEGVARPGVADRRQILRRSVGEALLRHRGARAAVRVERHRVRIRRPHRVEVDRPVRRRRQVLDGRLVRMRHRAGCRRRPALERVARARKRVRRQRLRRVIGHREIRHRAAAAVRVELHRVGVRLPDRVQGDRSVRRRRQVAHRLLVGIDFASRSRRRPTLERVARAREGVCRQRLRDIVGERLVRHRARALVGVELHRVAIRLVGRGQRHRASGHRERRRRGRLVRE